MLSVGYSTGLSLWFPAIPISSDIIPTRPMNIAEDSNILEPVERSDVMPSEDPTVNSAEHDSNSRLRAGRSGSSDSNMAE